MSARATGGLGDAVRNVLEAGELAGAVMLVTTGSAFLALEATGYADLASKAPMKRDTMFWIASITKTVTAATLMTLVDEDRVSLDAPIAQYLPDFAPQIVVVTRDRVERQSPKNPISVRHLLSHVSGLPFCSAAETSKHDLHPLSLAVESYVKTTLLCEPGSGFTYSNAGINTIGRVIETVSDQPYADFVHDRLFAPLGMKDTTFWPDPAQCDRVATAYAPGQANAGLRALGIVSLQTPLSDRAARFALPAGGLFSTATDLGWFAQMLLNRGAFAGQRILSEAAIDAMTQGLAPHLQSGVRLLAGGRSGRFVHSDYGLGTFLYEGGAFGHSGAYGTHLRIDPENGIATVWMVQQAGYPGQPSPGYEAFEAAAIDRFAQHQDAASGAAACAS